MSTYGLEPAIEIDNMSVFIIPGTWSYTPGYPEISTNTISSGRNTFELYRTQDSSTAFSTFKFDIPATRRSITLLQQWKARNGQIQIVAEDEINNEQTIITLTQCSIDNNPEIESGNDAKISIEGTAAKVAEISITN